MLWSTLSILATAAGVVAHDTGARLTKPPLANNLDYLEKGLEEHLPQVTYTLSKWTNGYIPEEYVLLIQSNACILGAYANPGARCKNIVTGNVVAGVKFSPNDFDIYDVHYKDVSRPAITFTLAYSSC